MIFDVIQDAHGKLERPVRAGAASVVVSAAGGQNAQVALHRREFFGCAEFFCLFEERSGEPEENRAKSRVSRNSAGEGHAGRAKLIVDQSMGNAKIETRAISRAVRGPGDGGIDQGCVPAPQNRHVAVLAVSAEALQLGDDDTGAVVRMRVCRRILIEGDGARSKKRQLQISQTAAGDGSVEGKSAGKLEITLAANLPSVPQPGFLAVRKGNAVGGERLRNFLSQDGQPHAPTLVRGPLGGTGGISFLATGLVWNEELAANVTRFSHGRQAYFATRTRQSKRIYRDSSRCERWRGALNCSVIFVALGTISPQSDSEEP